MLVCLIFFEIVMFECLKTRLNTKLNKEITAFGLSRILGTTSLLNVQLAPSEFYNFDHTYLAYYIYRV